MEVAKILSGVGAKYFTAVNPTPGTGIASAVTAAFSATAGLLCLRNADSTGQRFIIPDFVRLIPTVVPASATRSELLVATDSITRYSSGGSAITGIFNVHGGQGNDSAAVLHFGAVVLAAESAARRLERLQLRSVIPVAFEDFLLKFSHETQVVGLLGGTSALAVERTIAPVVLAPNHSLVLHVWHPGNATTPASWEFTAGWWEAKDLPLE